MEAKQYQAEFGGVSSWLY